MAQPLGFVEHFRDLLRARGIRSAITSGMACVRFGIQQTTKDSDWIVEPAHLGALRQLLAEQQEKLPPWRVGYRTIFAAPLDVEWMRHGWTSHVAVQEEALGAEHHLDFFARPPRVAAWTADAEGFADRSIVAWMKRTDRDRDWPIVDGLGWQIAATKGGAGAALLHIQSPSRLREAWRRATADERDGASQRRPVLLCIDREPDDDRLEAWIRIERLVWHCVNRERYGRYQAAWKAFFRRWRAEPDWSWPTIEPFARQHERVVAAARRHELTKDPLAGLGGAQLRELAIAKAATIALQPEATVRSVAPGPNEVFS